MIEEAEKNPANFLRNALPKNIDNQKAPLNKEQVKRDLFNNPSSVFK